MTGRFRQKKMSKFKKKKEKPILSTLFFNLFINAQFRLTYFGKVIIIVFFENLPTTAAVATLT
jgi:hypothetical protein